MKWTLTLITELDSGVTKVHEVANWERTEPLIKPASLGMSIEESKRVAASIQAQMVSDQVDRHNKALMTCRFCGKRVRTKGYYRSVFKSGHFCTPLQVTQVNGP